MTVRVYTGGAVVQVIDEAPAAPLAPSIVGFAATPGVISPGQQVTLSGTVANAVSVSLNGTVIPGLPQIVVPSSTTTYTLVATGAPGTTPASQSLTVTVNAPPATAPVIVRTPLNLSRLVCFNAQYSGGAAYDRWANHVVFSATAFSIAFGAKDVASGGGQLTFAHPQYRLKINGVERATYMRLGAERVGTFTGNFTEADGPQLLEFVPYDAAGNPVAITTAGETPVPFWAWLDRNGQAKNHPDVIVQTGSHCWTHESYGVQAYVRLPKTLLRDRNLPLPARVGTPFSTYLTPNQVTRTMLVPTVEANSMQTYKPCVTRRGITVTENMQGYFPRDMTDQFPRLPQLDGPRGTATGYYPLHIQPGRNGKWYATTPHSLVVFDSTGTKRTLAGLRHKFAPYWAEAGSGNGPEMEIVGDWSAVPVTRRVIWESWGLAWDPRTLAVDLSAPPVGNPPEPPHFDPGPVAFVVDRYNRCLKLQFASGKNGTQRTDPPVVREFITGLSDPWGIVFDSATTQLYISERGAHRISKWNADTGAYLGDVIAKNDAVNYGAVNQTIRRFEWAAGQSYTTARAANIVGPESLAMLDGFLYWGALAQAEVRRIDLATGLVEVCARPSVNFGGVGPYFVNIALNDNTVDATGATPRGGFGPHGTLFTVTFYNAEYGRPQAFKPIAGNGLTHSQQWTWQQYGYDVIQGPGGTWPNDAYPTACGVGNGMLASGSSLDGICIYRQRELGDVTNIDYAKATRGHNYWKSKSYDVLHGKYGYGYTSLPLPRGENADCDYWLTVSGHS